jgi:ankyrin repeat protein
LYSLIRRDAYILDRINAIPFVETPLHIAVSAGHTHFAMEIVRLKPSFAKKLNQDGFSPMHLALQNKQTQLVLLLLDVDDDLVRVQGREGVTPLHYVDQTGNLNLLAEFLKVCPKSIEDVTIRRETVLHIALKYNMFDAFRLVLGWLRLAWFRNASLWEKKLLNWQDEEGNTVLHIAVSQNQPQASSHHSCFLLKKVNI